jgi:hypothetical protein
MEKHGKKPPPPPPLDPIKPALEAWSINSTMAAEVQSETTYTPIWWKTTSE